MRLGASYRHGDMFADDYSRPITSNVAGIAGLHPFRRQFNHRERLLLSTITWLLLSDDAQLSRVQLSLSPIPPPSTVALPRKPQYRLIGVRISQ